MQTDLMSASISDPFLLASYSLPSLPGRASAHSSASKASHVLLDSQYASTSDKSNNFVSLAVQGDGVHVLDVSLHVKIVLATIFLAVFFYLVLKDCL